PLQSAHQGSGGLHFAHRCRMQPHGLARQLPCPEPESLLPALPIGPLLQAAPCQVEQVERHEQVEEQATKKACHGHDVAACRVAPAAASEAVNFTRAVVVSSNARSALRYNSRFAAVRCSLTPSPE